MEVTVTAAGVPLPGELDSPTAPAGVVVFAHGSGSGRLSPRNTYVARVLHDRGLATLLFDLLLPEEDTDRARRFDIDLLARRLSGALDWLATRPELAGVPRGLFGASTGAAAALAAAADRPDDVRAVVSRGGRPDLAGEALPRVQAPTLLIVGDHDGQVLELNRRAAAAMTAHVELEVITGASHLFAEPGTLEQAAHRAADWFAKHLTDPAEPGPGAAN